MAAMDEIDQAQQREIAALQRKDVGHDRELIIYRVGGTIIVLLMMAMFAWVMETMEKTGPYSCPHPDCVHHRASK